MSYTTKQVLELLRNVKFPAKGKNIVELGMVEDLKIEGKKISFALRFEKQNDPNIALVKQACVMTIIKNLGDDVEIKGNIETRHIPLDSGHILPGVKNVIAVASGKGGVGKSTVSANLAVALQRAGYKVGLLDADIYGPSVPMMFDVMQERPEVRQENGKNIIIPIEKYGIKVLSIGFFVDPDQALMWRGPMASNALTQLFNDADWGALDFLLVDLPPGTGDIHLTLVQNIPVTGVAVVSTPQKVALADARKAVSMFRQESINVPVLGLIENMSWFTPAELPDNKYYIFGKDGGKNFAEEAHLSLLGQIPIVQDIREAGDNGKPIDASTNELVSKAFDELALSLEDQLEIRNIKLAPTKVVQTDPNEAGCGH